MISCLIISVLEMLNGHKSWVKRKFMIFFFLIFTGECYDELRSRNSVSFFFLVAIVDL